MNKVLGLLFAAAMLLPATWANAQPQAWVQIEARPNQALAAQRAADYAARLANVNGFRLSSGWYGIALGPYTQEEAEATLFRLRSTGAIPSDSFVSDGGVFRNRFFGAETAAAVAAPAAPLEPGEETVQEARTGERLLTREEREEVQIALRSAGFYNSIIDADFGPGTRRAMGAWQAANGFEATGVMTALQRRTLVDGYRQALDSLRLGLVTDDTAGVEVSLPMALVAFDAYDPPFARFESATDDGARAFLISQTGDRATLAALYDILETLEIMPLEGSRALRRNDFTLTGSNDEIVSHAYARLVDGAVKGFILTWPAGDEERRRLALATMEETFRPLDDVLPDSFAGASQDVDLLAGLQIRRPERARSGFFVDNLGAVLTTSEAVRQCTRVLLNGETEADVTAEEGSLGLALLKPRQSLEPIAFATLAGAEPRLQSDISVSGYSFGGLLTAPSLTYGTFADVKGLNGDARVQRLEILTEPGDAGGPVFDGSGAVAGMLLSAEAGGRQLPDNVAFAADGSEILEFLSANGVRSALAEGAEEIAPEDLTQLAAGMTVLVSCWN
ncbi:MAG: serine protease [Paracoccaceae bacterium]|nr:serine protease [Paracoccaceae bacterium]